MSNNNKPKVVEEYFVNLEDNKGKVNHYEEIFNPQEENIDLQTEVTDKEISSIATLKTFDNLLEAKGIGTVYAKYLNYMLRLKISKDRKSRGEYVDVNKNKQEENEIAKHLGNIKIGQ